MGALAFGFLIAAEAVLGIVGFGRSWAQHWDQYHKPAAQLGLAAQMIFAGAPYAEAIRTITALRTALLAITAAVLGVIMNLAVWFGLHVIFTRIETVQSGPARLYVPDVASFDPVALGITAAAAVLLIRIKLGVIPVLLLCAALGAAWQLRAMWL